MPIGCGFLSMGGSMPGTHVDLVGAFRAHMRETDDAVMQRADLIVVDDRAAAMAEGGDVVQALQSGAIAPGKIAGDLRDLVRGTLAGRTNAGQITVFKSVGFALEDLAAADAVFGEGDSAEAPASDDRSHSVRQ